LDEKQWENGGQRDKGKFKNESVWIIMGEMPNGVEESFNNVMRKIVNPLHPSLFPLPASFNLIPLYKPFTFKCAKMMCPPSPSLEENILTTLQYNSFFLHHELISK
jgi:hypothetical protein